VSVVSGSAGQFPKSLLEFQGRFATEGACAEYLFERRWPEGFVCPGCGGGRAWLLKTKAFTYECADCRRQTSVTAGTIMHASKLPLTMWFWAAFLMATHSNGISALQLQSQLSLGSYRTAWMLAAKLRRAMVNPERAPLSGLVEADETIIPFRTKSDPVVVPAGRSGVGKMLVAGAVEIDGGTPRRARLKVIDGFGKQELHAFVLGAVAPQTQLVTDDWPSYQNLPGVRHDAITLGPMAAHIALPWIHRLFSNLKRWGLGVYHGLRKTNLQHYLDEFVFRFNRRRTRHAAFDTLLVIGARTTPAPYRVLIRKAA
jgi:ISXO2-like transposase domain/Transposase zinc-ribbon domain